MKERIKELILSTNEDDVFLGCTLAVKKLKYKDAFDIFENIKKCSICLKKYPNHIIYKKNSWGIWTYSYVDIENHRNIKAILEDNKNHKNFIKIEL